MTEVTYTETGRLRMEVRGTVQGVGFRPYVYRLARTLGLNGWVRNTAQGACIEVEGDRLALEQMVLRLEAERPPRCSIQGLETTHLDPVGYPSFDIQHSQAEGARTALILPDIATCPDCLAEVFDSRNRRFGYPFTNCTNCGPRFSIIESLPYDRRATSMRGFSLCEQCHAEYENPLDRRFHAQPNACPVCGPHLELWDSAGDALQLRRAALEQAAEVLRRGQILAVKGLGGFHLMVLAGSEKAVARLRQRKRREEKPLAVMAASLEMASALAELTPLEERLLNSPEAPIVIVKRKACEGTTPDRIAPTVAPGNPYLGLMLPYTPLHHLLLRLVNQPVVATSGNLTDEPICTDEREALSRLKGIADFLLVHNRPILRALDDSVVRVVLGREMVLRRARGYAPLPVMVGEDLDTTLAVGGQLKNTVGLAAGTQVFLSQHIGDLESDAARQSFLTATRDLPSLYDLKPVRVACDLHPDYSSSQKALSLGLPVISVQHHLAHVLSCMAENRITQSVLGVSWDGTGYGSDGTVWGGEFLQVTPESWRRAAHLRTFPLPGGDRAVKEPRRSSLGLLYELYGEEVLSRGELPPVRAFAAAELSSLRTALARHINTVRTSSAGRLFDAVASLLDLRQQVRFEGQAAMELEFQAQAAQTGEGYPFEFQDGTSVRVDWAPMLEAILAEMRKPHSVAEIAARFHNTLAEMIVAVADRIGERRVVLSGGCFQNTYLLERSVERLQAAGFNPYWHQRVPTNDGGLALGQVMAACYPRQQL